MSTMKKVREAIDPTHQAIEQTEFSKSLMDGRITRGAYCQYLTQMWHIHYRLEQTLPVCVSVGKYFEYEMIRTPAIERDLSVLGSSVEEHAQMTMTIKIEEQFDAWAKSAPFALLGCCYILEGSRMGSLMIGRALIKSLHLDSSGEDSCVPGVEYHLHNAAQTPRRVKQLKQAIDSGNLTAVQEQELTLGACTFMEMLNELYQHLPVQSGHGVGNVAKCPMHGMMHPHTLHPNQLKSA